MTTPKEKREEKGVLLDGGETGRTESALKIASRTHAIT